MDGTTVYFCCKCTGARKKTEVKIINNITVYYCCKCTEAREEKIDIKIMNNTSVYCCCKSTEARKKIEIKNNGHEQKCIGLYQY